MLDALITEFEAIEDPRDPCRVEHRLIDILIIAVCAVLGQAESFEDMADYGRYKEAWLRRFLALPNGIPSHDTFRRVYMLIDPDAFERVFLAWVRSAFAARDRAGPAAAGGGRRQDAAALPRPREGLAPVQLVSAYATGHGITLGQAAVPPGAGERAAVPALLDGLDLTGCLVTLDAGFCQKGIAREIRARDADYLVCLKANQRKLHAAVRAWFDQRCLARGVPDYLGRRQPRRRPRPPGAPARVRLPRARRPAGPARLAGRAGRARGRDHPRPPPGPVRDH